MLGTLAWITQWECPGSDTRDLNTHIMSILCNAMRSKLQCRIADLDRMRVPDGPMPQLLSNGRRFETLTLGFGGIHRCPADDLAHFAGLLGEHVHLPLHIFAVQPHDF